MIESRERHELRRVDSPEAWAVYHEIREAVLWTGRGLSGYKHDHPDELNPAFEPLLLCCEDIPVGTVRLDIGADRTGFIRLVAIRGDQQGRGHGRALLTLVERRARDRGVDLLYVTSALDAVGFYQASGYELVSSRDGTPTLSKELRV